MGFSQVLRFIWLVLLYGQVQERLLHVFVKERRWSLCLSRLWFFDFLVTFLLLSQQRHLFDFKQAQQFAIWPICPLLNPTNAFPIIYHLQVWLSKHSDGFPLSLFLLLVWLLLKPAPFRSSFFFCAQEFRFLIFNEVPPRLFETLSRLLSSFQNLGEFSRVLLVFIRLKLLLK